MFELAHRLRPFIAFSLSAYGANVTISIGRPTAGGAFTVKSEAIIAKHALDQIAPRSPIRGISVAGNPPNVRRVVRHDY